MEPAELRREIRRRKKRAADLGVDALLIRIYFVHGFGDYALRASDPGRVYPSVAPAAQPQRGRVDFTFKGRRYAIVAKARYPNSSRREIVEMEVFDPAHRLVFAQVVGRRRWFGVRAPEITAFQEGPWIEDMRLLEREIIACETTRRRHAEQASAAEYAARFGLQGVAVPRRERRSTVGSFLLSIFGRQAR